MVARRLRAVQAVIFDYGGVTRRDSREAYDAVDAAQGLARRTLWEVFHDIPEYRLSRNGTIDRDTFRAAVRRVLSQRAGEARARTARSRRSTRTWLRCRRWTPTCGRCSSSCAPLVV